MDALGRPRQPTTVDDAPGTVKQGAGDLTLGAGSPPSPRASSAGLATALARRSCASKTKTGAPCPANAMRAKDADGAYRCFHHSLSVNPEKRRLTQMRGGLESARVRFLPDNTPLPCLSNPEGVRALIEETVQAVRTGRLAPNAAQAVISGVNSAIKLAELVVASQLAALEERLNAKERESR